MVPVEGAGLSGQGVRSWHGTGQDTECLLDPVAIHTDESISGGSAAQA